MKYDLSDPAIRELLAGLEDDERTSEDLEDARRACDYLDMVESFSRFTDCDLLAAGLPVG